MTETRKTYARVEKFVAEHPWAILDTTLESILEVLQLRAEGRAFTDDEIRQRLQQTDPRLEDKREILVAIGGPVAGPAAAAAPAPARIALVRVMGVLAHRMNMFTAMSGGTSTEQLAAAVRTAVNDPAFSAVVLDIDSPGGSVFGVQELGDEIFKARGPKPIIAVANATAASAAYWIGSQADEFIVTPSGQVGSVGVVAVHTDRSKQLADAGVKTTLISAGKHKVDGNQTQPLDDDTRAAMQRRVDQYYSAFVKAVARGRGVSVDAVRDGFGEGRVVSAQDALRAGMVDGIRTMDDVLGRIAGGAKRVAGGARAEQLEEIAAAAEPAMAAAAAPGKLTIDDFRKRLEEL